MDAVIADRERFGIRVLNLSTHCPDGDSVGRIRKIQGSERRAITAGEAIARAVAMFAVLSKTSQIERERVDVGPSEWVMAIQNLVTTNPVQRSWVTFTKGLGRREFAEMVGYGHRVFVDERRR